MSSYDFAIVGGGILGLSTGMALSERYPGAGILVLEKEDRWAAHQTGRNSGVIHSGIYYRPGSSKATLAVRGNRAMVEFCREHGIDHDVCGKLIVATDPAEIPPMEELLRRGQANGVGVERIGPEQIREIEPHVNGIAALRVPSAGIVDFGQVARTFASLLEGRGAELRLGTAVRRIVDDGQEVLIETEGGSFRARRLVNCAGLQSDRIARLAGVDPGARIVPFRGEYFELRPEKHHLVKHLVYPVPNPLFPFLGVHFTRMIKGGVHAGPNAILALRREGYRKRDVSLRDTAEVIAYPGFWRLAARHWRIGVMELRRSLSKARFVQSLQRLVPDVVEEDLMDSPAGVRAQALDARGQLIDDFLIVAGPRSIHVCNAPSPAATSSIAIGRVIADRVENPSLNTTEA